MFKMSTSLEHACLQSLTKVRCFNCRGVQLQLASHIYTVVQTTDTQFYLGITSVIQHRFLPLFHCYKQKFMACKNEVLHTPHLYCVTTLPSKTNTIANIGANSWTRILQSQRYGVGRSTSYGEEKGGLHRFWSESKQLILLQYCPREGSAAWHQNNMSSLQVDTAAGWSASAHRPDNDGLFEKRAHQLNWTSHVASK